MWESEFWGGISAPLAAVAEEHQETLEIGLNPGMTFPKGIPAVDARIIEAWGPMAGAVENDYCYL